MLLNSWNLKIVYGISYGKNSVKKSFETLKKLREVKEE